MDPGAFRSVGNSPVKKSKLEHNSSFKPLEFELLNEDFLEDQKEVLDEEAELEGKQVFDNKFKKEVEEGEELLDSYACAVAMKILLQGRLYVTNKKLYFHSYFNNKLLFFGKDTKLVIPFKDIISLEKRVNAIFFDNSIAIITKDEQETFFTSFLMRDNCYNLIKQHVGDVGG